MGFALVSKNKPGVNLIFCQDHVDKNVDMLCDACGSGLSFGDYVEKKTIEATANDNSVVKIAGRMPKDTVLETTDIGREDAIVLAQKYVNDIESGDVLCAYDISMISNSMEYQPGDYNQSVKVNISNLDLDINDTVALLHIIDENNYEILPLSKVSNSELEFKATRFSTYILIYVDTYTITFSGDGNFEVLDTEGNKFTNNMQIETEETVVDGITIPKGSNFNFVIVPDDGYGITDVTLLDASEDASGDNYLEVMGYILGKTGKINRVSQNLVINVTTVLAPTITVQPISSKVVEGEKAVFTISAENATTFTWQYRENSEEYWKDATTAIGSATSGDGTSTFTTVESTYQMAGYEFRCLVGDENFTGDEMIKSNMVYLLTTQDVAATGEAPIIMVQPETQKLKAESERGVFEVTAMGTDLTFAWQYRENSEEYWKDVTTAIGSSEESVIDEINKKSTFTTVATTYQMSGYEFRCLVGNKFYTSDNAIKSDIAYLIVTNNGDEVDVEYFELEFSNDIESQKVALGDIVTFVAEAKGASSYRWQYRKMGEETLWEDVDSTIGTGYNTDTLIIDTSKMSFDEETLEITNNLSGYEFRCVITNSAVPIYEKESNVAFLVISQDVITADVVYQMPVINFTASSGESASEITLTWDMTDGITYTLYYVDNNGNLTLLDENVVTPYAHSGLDSNTSYEYIIIGTDESDSSYIERESAIGSTSYDDIYDRINKDTIKPILSNETITPLNGIISPNSEVILTFDITDDNYDALNGSLLYPDDIEILVNGIDATTAVKVLTKESITSGERFTLTINNIWGDGDLSIKIPAGAITDLAKNGNDEYIINTDISVVRNLIKPITNFRATSGDSANSITISWEDSENTGDVKYVLEVSSGDNNWRVLSGDAVSPYIHSGLSKNMSFEYRIKVVTDAGDESPYIYTIGRTEYDPNYGDVMIDTVNPVINFIGIDPDVDYIGASQELTITFESFDENYNKDMTLLTADKFIVKVAGTELTDVVRSLTVEDISSGERFILTLSNITGTGKLTVEVPAEVIIDSALNPNVVTEFDTTVTAMNGAAITDHAPTLVPDVHTITVSTNQVNTIPVASIVYEYRISGDGDFTEWQTTTDLSSIITNLSSNTDYEVRTIMTDVANNSVTSQSAFTTTKKIDASAITIDHETKEWTNAIAPNPLVTATITWNDTVYTHQYSTNNIDWTTVTEDMTELNITENVTIYARYSDGVGHSDPIIYEIENIDTIKPVIGKVEVPEGKANKKTIKVSEITDEGGSNLKGYYINTEADLTNVIWTTLTESSFEFVVTENDVYYIWVIDNAGNISNSSSANVTDIVDEVTNATIEQDLEIEVFEKITPTLTYSGEAKEIIYEIADSGIATIDPTTGEITGVASGETIVTVTIKNYDEDVPDVVLTTKLTVHATTPNLTINEPTEFEFIYGDASDETTFTYDGSGDLTVSSDNPSTATGKIEGNKIIVTPGNVGTATITINASETPQYLGVSKTITVTVTPRVLEIIWDETKWGDYPFTYDGTEKTVTATINNLVDPDTVNITYSGNKETNAGNYTAEIISIDNPNYTIDTLTDDVLKKDWVINRADRTLDIIKNLTVTYGIPETITFTYEGEDVTAIVESGDGSVITATLVDGVNSGDIIVNAVKAGTQTISVTIPESDNYNSISANVTIITELTTGEITGIPTDITLTYGQDPVEIEYQTPSNGDMTVTSSNESVVKVSGDTDNKTITVTPGNASDDEVIITVKTEQTEQYEEAEVTIKVKVNPKPVILAWSGDTFTYDGTEKEVTATVINKVGTDVVNVVEYTDNKKINANEYTAIAITLSNPNYTLTSGEQISHDWVINRADIKPTLNMEDYVYGGIISTPTVSGNSGEAQVTYYYYASGDDVANALDWSTVTDSLSLQPGIYRMYAVIEQSENYNGATTDNVEFYVIVGEMDIVLTENGEAYDGEWTNNDVVATITVPEEVRNLTAIYYRIEGDDTIYSKGTTSNVVSITFDKNINGNVYFVGVNVEGKAVTTESDGDIIRIDKTIPVIGNVTAPTEKANTKIITVSNITDEGGSEIAGYYVGTTDATTGVEWVPFSGDSFEYKVSENDVYYIFVKDTAGNISAAKTIEVENIVDEVTNATIDDNLEVEVFKSIISTLTYSGEAKEIIYEFADPTKATADSTTGIITGTNAGTTEVTITIKNYDEDIPDVVLTTTLTVTPRVVTLTWSGDIFIYDGTTKKVEATVTNVRDGDTVTVTKYTDNEKIDVGTYTAIAEELSNPNYTLEGCTKVSYEWKIIPDAIEPTVVMNNYVYGGDKPTPTVIGNYGSGEETFYVYSGDDKSKAINWDTVTSSIFLEPGTYKMYVEVGATANYSSGESESVEFKVLIEDIIVEVTESGDVYDGEWTNNDIVATITVPVEVTQMTSVYYRIDGETELRSVKGTKKDGNVITITFTENINEDIYFVAVNVGGIPLTNESSKYTIKIDKTKPVVGKVSVPEGNANTKVITVENITDEGGSGIAGYYVSTDEVIGNVDWVPFSGDSFRYEVFDNDTYYIFVKDTAGNISDVTAESQVVVENIVDKVSNARFEGDLLVEVFDTIAPVLKYDGVPEKIVYSIEDESIASINPITGTITGVASGDTKVIATITDYDGTITIVSCNLSVIATEPSLIINAPTELKFTYGDPSGETTFSYSGSGELSVSSDDESVAKVELIGNRVVVTPGNAGTATVTVHAGETPEYVAVEKTIPITVNKRIVTLEWSEDTFTYDKTQKEITAIVTNKVGNDVVDVTEYEENQKTNAGDYTAKATKLNNDNYTLENSINTKYWKINKADRELTLTPESLTLEYGVNGTVSFEYTGEVAMVTASSSSLDVVQVTDPADALTGEFTVIPEGAGECEVTLKVDASDNYNGIEKVCKVKVTATDPSLTIENPDITLTYGDIPVSTKFDYTGNSTNLVVSSSDPNVVEAVISGNEIIITPKEAGTVTITLVAPATGQYNQISGDISVTVNPRPISVTWGQDEFTYDGTEKTITVQTINNLVGDDKITLTYSGNVEILADTYTAEVIGILDENGLESRNYTVVSGENITHEWKINKADRVITVQDEIVLKYGTSGNVVFEYKGEDVEAQVSNSNDDVATITYLDENKKGTVTVNTVAKGESIVTIYIPESANYNEATGTFLIKVELATPQVQVSKSEITYIYGADDEEISYEYNGNGNVSISTSDNNVVTASVDQTTKKITINPRNVGTATLTLLTAETSQFESTTTTIKITVNPRPVELDWGNTTLLYDGTLKTITATVTNPVGNDNVTVTGYEGNTGTEIGSYEATATSLSNANYTLTGGINITTDWKIREVLPPDIIVKQGENVIKTGGWASGDVTITIESTDISGVEMAYEYSFNNKDWIEYTGTIAYSKETTGTTIYARVFNKQNGVALSLVGEHELKIDKGDPEIKIISINTTENVNGVINKDAEITIVIEVEDLIAGIDENQFTADDIKIIAVDKGQTRELMGIQKVLVADASNAGIENGTYRYTLTLSNIDANGRLSLNIAEKKIYDRSTRYNQAKTLNLGLTADNEGPDIGIIQTSADSYGRVFGEDVDLEVTAKDDSGISKYEWQVSRDGKSWETFLEDETTAEISDAIYKGIEDGNYHFRVVVTDAVGNQSTSQISTVNINITMNRKPTIRFESEQVTPTEVKIIAIVKSTRAIETIKINASPINKQNWNTEKINNEITVTTSYSVTENGIYTWTVEDEVGNVVTEEFNVTTIDDSAAQVTYKTFDATEYSLARIEFESSNQEFRISKVIRPNGAVTNILDKTSYTGMTFGTIDFTRKLTVQIAKTMDFEPGTTFVFENKAFLETKVKIEQDIDTKVMYIRTVSDASLSLFGSIFGSADNKVKVAEALVNQMALKTKEIHGTVNSYYGLIGTSVELKLSEQDELLAVGYLASASKNGKVLRVNQYGDAENLKATVEQDTGGSNTTYTNGNITGLKSFGNILNWTGDEDTKDTFRITIRAK